MMMEEEANGIEDQADMPVCLSTCTATQNHRNVLCHQQGVRAGQGAWAWAPWMWVSCITSGARTSQSQLLHATSKGCEQGMGALDVGFMLYQLSKNK